MNNMICECGKRMDLKKAYGKIIDGKSVKGEEYRCSCGNEKSIRIELPLNRRKLFDELMYLNEMNKTLFRMMESERREEIQAEYLSRYSVNCEKAKKILGELNGNTKQA